MKILFMEIMKLVRVSQRGKVALFIKDNREMVDDFLKLVKVVGYSDNYLNEFLLSLDYDKPNDEVLSIDLFGKFRDNYVDKTTEEGNSKKYKLSI